MNLTFIDALNESEAAGKITREIALTLRDFYNSYASAIKAGGKELAASEPLLTSYLKMVERELKSPFSFDLFHKAITSPFDYYSFGLDFMRPLVIFEESKLLGGERVKGMVEQIERGDNVIFLANHQTEPDPQVISLLLEESYPDFAREMIFVAGHRVTTDPLCVPLSMGRNLLCIYSKKHILHSAKSKEEMLLHNRRTMEKMGELLARGGKAIYVAPSGGRDRPNSEGVVEVAPFDASSVEMFRLMALRSGRKTHFYPLSLATYRLFPPPSGVREELGEERRTEATAVHLAFGEEWDSSLFEGEKELAKEERREKRAQAIREEVVKNYELLIGKVL